MLTPLYMRRRLGCAFCKPRLRITYSNILLTNQGRSKFAESHVQREAPPPTAKAKALVIVVHRDRILVMDHVIEYFPLVCGVAGFLVLGLNVVYNLYLHPLRAYPGPWYTRASILPYVYWLATGELTNAARIIHEKYGKSVRLAPNKLSFIQSEAWSEIHGHRNVKRKAWFDKDPSVYLPRQNGAPSIVDANEHDHARFRRLLAHAFSEKALRDQEGILMKYVDLLVAKLSEQIESPNAGILDMSEWTNAMTFDIIGDLTFGRPFDCLSNGKLHPWVELLPGAARTMTYLLALKHAPSPVFKIIVATISPFLGARSKHAAFTNERINLRLAEKTERSDFITPILKANDEKGMSHAELESSINLLVTAGSETLATFFAGAIYHLCNNKNAYKRLQKEVKEAFPSPGDVSIESTQRLPYLHAVIEEVLRIYPPAALSLARIVPHGGAVICGDNIPAGTSVGVTSWAATHSPSNFAEPELFAPERWLDDPRFATDDRAASQPFSIGGRNCLGKNLAYAEMRLTLTKLAMNFDFELLPQSQSWISQKLFTFWEKPPLMVRVHRISDSITKSRRSTHSG